ncbi:hypothetical protein RGE_29200 [Rubrivivax gelatinosus IL144]|uniref:Tfp pilus assembly protein FimV n=1 Tax=Rubrivivax gelatinosus (strain NBRC 100245 / IL144) TaxID=983917 RepID=I0HTC2_RUBGI|nr:hypothetical protein RGE_29200 [Rubrivivax gelatinosus IL144]
MLQKRPPSTIWIAIALLSAAQSASALGWARADQAAVLGRPLSFSATLRLDPGDQISPECVRAEVMSGDRVLPASLVHVHADVGAEALAMRVATEPTIDEPVVTVTLAIGCPTRLSRRFVLFADPAPVAAPTMAAAVPQSRPVDLPSPAAAPATPTSAAAAPAPARAEPRRRAVAAETAAPRPRPAAPARSTVATPRLKLDPVESLPLRAQATAEAASAVQDAIAAVSRAASAAEAAASSASAAEARVATLEQTVKQLRADAEQSRQLVSELRRQLADAREDRWRLPLMLAVAALLALAGGLWWRLRALQQERQRAWQRAATAEAPPRPPMPTSQLPLMTSEIPMPPPAPLVPPPRPPVEPATSGPEVHEIHSERTQILPTGSRADEGAPRDVTIEELLDLEQQAEFFIVLGQDDAAIDLLVEHLRDTGGGSPLPYLKLLEIYRRRGEREAYERTRERFNRRFNAYAPEWEADLQHGRSLDDYPGVLPRLQQVWGRPLDAMAELEALLFRKSRGELFDLPAYREVLFLYSLARDLLDREAVESGTVDLLLPLTEEAEFGMTSPHPYLTLERDSVFDPGIAEPPSVAAIDLDLSELETESDPGPPTAPDGGLNLIPPRG